MGGCFAGLYGRLGTRYAIRATGVPTLPRSRWTFGLSGQGRGASNSGALPVARLRGRHLLDHEALTCLLVLLFMDEPKLNTTRLFRVLRNLCYHGPTRTWILRALLSILQRTSECHPDGEEPAAPANAKPSTSGNVLVMGSGSGSEKGGKGRKGQQQQQQQSSVFAAPVEPGVGGSGWSRGDSTRCPGSWLSISLEAALGCRANVFQVQRATGGKKSAPTAGPQGSSVNIHPQAAPVVCRHVLDTLISLAKIFPNHFLPGPKVREVPSCEARDDKDSEHGGLLTPASSSGGGGGARPKVHVTPSGGATSPRLARSDRSVPTSSASDVSRPESDFWSLLLRLDGASLGRKGKGMQRTHSSMGSLLTESEALGSDYNSSALGQLMAMLSHPVVRRSQLLTDRLLRLLGLISVGLQENAGVAMSASTAASSPTATTAATATATTTTTTTAAAASTTPAPVTVSSANGSAAPAESASVASAAAAQPLTPTSETPAPPESKPLEGRSLRLSVCCSFRLFSCVARFCSSSDLLMICHNYPTFGWFICLRNGG